MKLQGILLAVSISVISASEGKVDTIHNPDYNPHGPSLYLNALLKYNCEAKRPGAFSLDRLIHHLGRLKNNRRRRDAGNGLSPEEPEIQNVYYLNPLTIGQGDTAQKFNLQFDTGAPDLWVISDQLPSVRTGNQSHTLYKAGETATSRQIPGQSWEYTYVNRDGVAGVGGNVYNDTISLGGVLVSNALVLAANKISIDLADNPADGILGLTFGQSMSEPQTFPTNINQIANGTAFQLPLFTALLTRSTETPGFFTFGYINDTVVPDRNITFTPVLENPNLPSVGFWTFASEFAVINGKRLNRTGNKAICDTATSAILLDTSTTDAIYQTIPGAKFSNDSQGYIFPAANTQFPNVSLPAGNTEITLQSPKDFSLAPAVEDGFLFGSIQDGGGNLDILGVPWLNNVYAVFDFGVTGPRNNRFGVVQRPIPDFARL